MPSLHRLRAKPKLVDRLAWLEGLAVSKDVVHLGFLDVGRVDDKTAAGIWLHQRIARVARRVIGIDLDPKGVAAAREAGYEAYSCDLEDREAVTALNLAPAGLVIAGELIEHLDSPGRFFEAVKPLVAEGGELVLTTPNAVSVTSFLVALSRREWVNPDHVGMYSWRTLAALLERHDWEMTDVLFYYRGKRMGPEAKTHRVLALGFNAYERALRPFLRVAPTLADGLIVVAKRTG
jgi:2-polyprenyl-3-methyl-5-hydroxy-6-metoxy-1,4-benzoquinol methylase